MFLTGLITLSGFDKTRQRQTPAGKAQSLYSVLSLATGLGRGNNPLLYYPFDHE
jgi:hypothetical protein